MTAAHPADPAPEPDARGEVEALAKVLWPWRPDRRPQWTLTQARAVLAAGYVPREELAEGQGWTCQSCAADNYPPHGWVSPAEHARAVEAWEDERWLRRSLAGLIEGTLPEEES